MNSIEALNAVIVGAGTQGDVAPQTAMAHVTQFCFSGLLNLYDCLYADTHYNASSLGATDFDLTGYLGSTQAKVNCWDQACGVVILGSLLGLIPEYDYLDDFGYINSTSLVGWGGPINDPKTATLKGADDTFPDRQPFGNHAVAQYASKVHDATVGPHKGTQDIAAYANAAVDVSTAAERNGSIDGNQDGTITAAEVADKLTVGAVTGMH